MLPHSVFKAVGRAAHHALLPPRQALFRRAVGKDAAEASPAVVNELARNRRSLLRRLETVQFTVAGVTFEGRQEAVSQLQRGQAVLLLPEPGSPYDPHAIEVHTLSGTPLGYVPRDLNVEFKHGVYAGHVVSAGQVRRQEAAPGSEEELGPWGAQVRAVPRAVPILPIPLPSAFRGSQEEQQLQQMCTPGSEAHAAAMKAAKNTCEASWNKARDAVPLEVAPLWVMDKHAKVVQLLRLVVLCKPLAQALQYLRMQPTDPAYTAAEQLIRQYNTATGREGWTTEEMAQYKQWASDMQAQMDAETWPVNLAPPANRSAEVTA